MWESLCWEGDLRSFLDLVGWRLFGDYISSGSGCTNHIWSQIMHACSLTNCSTYQNIIKTVISHQIAARTFEQNVVVSFFFSALPGEMMQFD